VLLVVCADGATADWAAAVAARQRAQRGPVVVGPDVVPRPEEVPLDTASLELAVLAAQAHTTTAGDVGALKAVLEAVARMPREAAVVYFDLIWKSLDDLARRALEEVMQYPRFEFQSDFARKYYGEGIAEGEKKGLEKGREEGREEARRTVAMRLLARGVTVAEVVELTGLTEEDVRALQG
jgi:predicted transposase/invertase (TIGR01784 family)